MKPGIELKQSIHTSAEQTRNLCADFAIAGTLCVYGGLNTLEAGVSMYVCAVALAELTKHYTVLSSDIPDDNMYEVRLSEPVELHLTPQNQEFEQFLQAFTPKVLELSNIAHNLRLSYSRSIATDHALEQHADEPEGARYQNAQLFHTLHRQALWRNLALSIRLHHEWLVAVPRLNMFWHTFKQRLPLQERFQSSEVENMFRTVWQNRRKDIEEYRPIAFGVHGYEPVIRILEQQQALLYPALLGDAQWHESTFMLVQALQDALDTFYHE